MATKDGTGTSDFLGVKLKDGMKDRITAIAERHGLSQSEVVRMFLEAGIEANPVTDTELAKVRAAKARATRRAPGLVIPIAPVASATPAPVTGAADENMEKMGIEPLRAPLRASRRSLKLAA